MTITPEEAKKMTEAEKNAISRLEKAIDASLLKDFGNNCYDTATYSISSSRDQEVTLRVRKEIIRMYEEAGWSVKYNSDQMDGDWFEFKPRGGYER